MIKVVLVGVSPLEVRGQLGTKMTYPPLRQPKNFVSTVCHPRQEPQLVCLAGHFVVDTTRINPFSTYVFTERIFGSPQFECNKIFLKIL